MNKETNITTVIRIALLLGLLVWCFLIIRPFLAIILWAIILGIAMFPLYGKLTKGTGSKKKKFITTGFAVVFMAVFLVPTYFIVNSVAQSTIKVASQIKAGSLEIPQPDEKVRDWPVVGEVLYKNWTQINNDIGSFALTHKDLILDQGKTLINQLTNFAGTIVIFILSFLIAVILMYNSEAGHRSANKFSKQLLGDSGAEIVDMSRDTIRGVVKGILLMAFIQAGLSFIGFAAIGLPAAGVFSILVLIAVIIQLPVILVMIPAIIIAFSIADTTPAIIFAVYSVLVGLVDNVLKPMLMGKGLKTPMIVLLIGTLGGMLLHGIIGLFIGAVVLAVGHRLYVFWVESNKTVLKDQ